MRLMLEAIRGREGVIDLIKNYFTLTKRDKSNVDKFICSLIRSYNSEHDVYLELFFNNVIYQQIQNLSENNKLLNQFIIRYSNDENIYNKYVKGIFQINYVDYHTKVNQMIKADPKLVDSYVNQNINEVSFENSLEMKMVDDYITRKLSYDSKLANKDIRNIVKFLIEQYSYKESLKTKVKTVTFIENLNKPKLKLPLILKKTKFYFNVYGYCDSNFVYDGLITINTDHFKIRKNLKFDTPTLSLFKLLITCFHELQHAKQNQKTKCHFSVPVTLYSFKEQYYLFLITNDYSFYFNNHEKFYGEIDANLVGCQHALEVLKKYSFKRYKEIKTIGSDYLKKQLVEKNNYDDDFIRRRINSLVTTRPKYIKEAPVLTLEYNKDGSKKNIVEILNQPTLELLDKDLIYYIIAKNVVENNLSEFITNIHKLSNQSLELVKQAIGWELKNINERSELNDEFIRRRYISIENGEKQNLKLCKKYCLLLKCKHSIEEILKDNKDIEKEKVLLKQR